LDDCGRPYKSNILWSKTKAKCDRRRAFDDYGSLTAASLEKGEEAIWITAGSKYSILGFTLEAVAYSTRPEGAESTE
ncbi:MAG: hypothetical protein Q9201_005200, partial [Fulgogasparrea decipioides]